MIRIRVFELQLREYRRDVKRVVKPSSCVVPELGLFLELAIFVRGAACLPSSRQNSKATSATRLKNLESRFYADIFITLQHHKCSFFVEAIGTKPSASKYGKSIKSRSCLAQSPILQGSLRTTSTTNFPNPMAKYCKHRRR
jgi:hypothetical protein